MTSPTHQPTKGDMPVTELKEQIDAWSFNVMLECSGRDESDMLMAVGGAFLDLRDLGKILTWATGAYVTPPTEPAGDVDPELIRRVESIASATGKDRWKVANLTGHDWRRILAAMQPRSGEERFDHERLTYAGMMAAMRAVAKTGVMEALDLAIFRGYVHGQDEERAKRVTAEPATNPCRLPIMRRAFRTTLSGAGRYSMQFEFPDLAALHAADCEWLTFRKEIECLNGASDASATGGAATATDPAEPASGAVSDAQLAAAARKALGEWLAWPDAPRDGPVPVDNEKTESWLSGLPNRLAGVAGAASGAQRWDAISDIIRDVDELPDRDSPDDWPEAMLVTGEELRIILERYATPATERAGEPVACSTCNGLRYLIAAPSTCSAGGEHIPCPSCTGTCLIPAAEVTRLREALEKIANDPTVKTMSGNPNRNPREIARQALAASTGGEA